MPDFQVTPDQLGYSQPTAGATPSLWESATGGYEQAMHVDSARGFDTDLLNNYYSNYGINRPWSNVFSGAEEQSDALRLATARSLKQPMPSDIDPDRAKQILGTFDQREAQMQSIAKESGLKVKSFDQVLQDTIAQRHAIQQESARLSQTEGIAGEAAQFVGGLPSGFDLARNPVQFGALFLGGAGESVAARLAFQAVAQGAAAGTQTAAFDNPTQAMLGEEQTSPLAAAAQGAAFGALAEGGGMLLGKGFKALRSNLFPDRAPSPIDLGVPEVQPRPFEELLGSEQPLERAQGYAASTAQTLAEKAPYGSAPEAVGRMFDEGQAAVDLFNTGDTAVGRFLPDSFDMGSFDEERVLADGVDPRVGERLDTAQQALSDATDRVAQAQNAIDSRGVADSAQLLDPSDEVTPQLIRDLEQRMDDETLSQDERAEAEQKLNGLVESIGPETLAKAESDHQIGLRAALKTARAGLKSVKQAYRDAQNEFDGVVSRARLEQDIRQRAAGLAPERPPSIFDYSSEVNRETLNNLEATRGDTLANVVEQTKPEEVPATEGEPAPEPKLFEPQPNYTLPDGTTIPSGFKLEDGTSVDDAFRDFADDDALLEAMRTCSL